MDRAKNSLKQGLQFLVERQKLIKLADRSDHGWSVVAVYTTDELAEDSYDEKRILKAEHKAAKRKKSAAAPPPCNELCSSLLWIIATVPTGTANLCSSR